MRNLTPKKPKKSDEDKKVASNYPTTRMSLIEKVRNGDEVSWTEFYERYAPVIRYVGENCYHFNDAECDELIQNTMCKFYDTSGKYTRLPGVAKFRTYFATVVRSQAVDYSRRNARRRETGRPETLTADDSPENNENNPEFITRVCDETFMREWRWALLQDACNELRERVSETTYQAFEMCAMQGRNTKSVCEALGISADQLYVAKSRCIAILREIIARYNREDEGLHLEWEPRQ
ncbi:MAG: sigma-70 family RNA polymerase sigma factor [Victivallaceae bacterium]|nr:sigma-70 family RNA polymerase sigma factor [Victivallaceae bacterium]